MNMYLRNLKCIIKHKWNVFLECACLGIPLRGLLHDNSKLFPDEFFAYAEYFFGPKDSEGMVSPTVHSSYCKAWAKHAARNSHHWQWWTARDVDGRIHARPMGRAAVLEMLADWLDAGRRQGAKFDPRDRYAEPRIWYARNRSNMILAPETRRTIETLLNFREV